MPQRNLASIPWGLVSGVCVPMIAMLTSSCSLLLDFDQFEAPFNCSLCSERDQSYADQCLEECPDSTQDERDSSTQEPPLRRCEPVSQSEDAGASLDPGLVHRRALEDLTATTIGKTQVLVSRDYLYHLAYVEQNGKADVVLRAFALNALDEEVVEDTPVAAVRTRLVSEFLGEGDVVRSPGTLAVDAADRVFLYVAHGNPETARTATLSRITFEPDLLQPSELVYLTEPPNYLVTAGGGRVGPEAGSLRGGEPFVTWQGCRVGKRPDMGDDWCAEVIDKPDGSAIFAHTGDTPLREEALERGVGEPLPIEALQALSDGTTPAAVWGTTSGDDGVSLLAGVPEAQHSATLLQCHAAGKYTLHSIHATPTFNGFSSIVWSKRSRGDEAAVTEVGAMGCTAAKCTDPTNTTDMLATQCDAAVQQRRVFDEVRGASHAVWIRPNTQNTESVIVSAKVVELDAEQTELLLTRTEGSPNPNVSPFLDRQANERSLARGTPNWPELHLQSSARQKPDTAYSVLGVAWVEKSAEATSIAKVETFDLCVEP